MESIQEMVDVNTVVGDAVETKNGTVIVPVSRVSAGFAAGGAQYEGVRGAVDAEGRASLPFGGGSGAGVTVQPVGFLVVAHDSIRFLPVDDRAVFDRMLDVAPAFLDQLAALVRGNGVVEEVVPSTAAPVGEPADTAEESTTVRVRRDPNY
jgi:sporulation protein YtfJ